MSIRLTEEIALERILNKIKKSNEIGGNIGFVGFKDNKWIGNKTILLIKCNIHNIILESPYYSFTNSRRDHWSCPECVKEKSKKANLKYKTKKDLINAINLKIEEVNSKGYTNISFLGFANEIDENNLVLSDIRISIKCNKHNIINNNARLDKFLLYGYMCHKCGGEKSGISRKVSNQEIYNRLVNKYDKTDYNYDFTPILSEEELGNMMGTRVITAICPEHGKFSHSLSAFLNFDSIMCPDCRRRHLNELNLEKMKQEIVEILERKRTTYGINYEFLGFKEYEGYYTRIILRCKDHNVTWDTTRYGQFRSDTIIGGCPMCKALITNGISKSEEKCYNILLKRLNKSSIIRQYKFKYSFLDLNIIKKFSLDFYIPDKNIVIEYNGGQHYDYTSMFHTDIEEYMGQVLRDLLLKKYCEDHNLKLLYIPYKDNNRLEDVIFKFLDTGEDITTKLFPKIY